MEKVVAFLHRAALFLRVIHLLVDVGIGAMHLHLAVTAVVIDKGHEHVVLEEIGDVAETVVEHHKAVHILVHNVLAEIAQTNLADRHESMHLFVPHHLEVRDDNGLAIEVFRLHLRIAFQFNGLRLLSSLFLIVLGAEIMHELRFRQVDGLTFHAGIHLGHALQYFIIKYRDFQHIHAAEGQAVVGILHKVAMHSKID